MALTVGELVAYATIDKSDFSSGTQAIGSDLSRLQSSTSSSMASMESTVTKSLSEIEQSIRDGLDPAAAIADLDRLERELDAGLQEMLDEADRFAAELDATIDEAFASLDDDAQQSGKKAGDELVDGLRAGVRDAERVVREAGEDAGDSFGDGVEGAGGGGRMAGIGSNLVGGLKVGALGVAAAAGAAIGAALMSGLESALDAESAKQKLFAQIGASEGEMKRLGNVAGKVYADGYGETVGDVTEAIKGLVQNVDGIRTASEESLGTLSKRAIDTGIILDEDVSKVTRSIAKILKTDLASSADEAFDILVRGAQLGGNEAEDLLDTYSEYSTQFRTLGLSGQQAMGLIVQGLQAGARDADVVADAIKEFSIEAVQGGERVRGGFKSLGLNADEMVAKFAKGGPTAAKAFDLVLDKLRGIEDPAKRNAAAVELFGTKAEDLGAALFALDPSAAVNTLGQVDGAAKKAGDTLNDTAEHKLTAFKRSLESNVVEFLGGTVLPALEDAAEAFKMSGALETLQGWADQIGEIWDSVVADVQEWAAANGETIEEWKTKLSEGFESMKEIVDTALAAIKEFWDKHGEEIVATVSFAVDSILSIWNTFWGTVSGLLDVFIGAFTGDWEQMGEGLEKIWDSLWQGIEDAIDRALGIILGDTSKTWNSLNEEASKAWDKLVAAITSKAAEIIADIRKLPDKIKAALGNLGTLLVQAGNDVINGFISGIRAKAAEVTNAIKSVVGLAEPTAKATLNEHSPSKIFEDIGGNTILGFIGGVIDKGKELAGTVAAAMDSVVSTAKTSTGTGSGGGSGGGARPSTIMHEIGKYTVKGLLDGLTSEGANVKGVVDKLVADIKTAFKSTPDVVDGLLDFVRVGNKNLEDLALQRQALVQQLADAKEMAKRVAGTAQEWADITGLKPEDITGAGDMAAELQGKASAINDFANNIQTLAKRGLNKKIIQDIIDAGVEKGATFAEMLVGSDGSEIKALNKAQAAVDKASKKLGKASADAMFDVGKKSGEGYLKGLEASLKDLDKAMQKIVDALVKAIKKELKIKSPSQVMAEIGQFTMAGFVQGMQSMETSTIAAMTGLVGKAVSATSDAAIGSVGKAAAASTSTEVLNGTHGTAGVAYTGPLFGGPNAGAPAPAGGIAGVTVNIENATIREEMDITKLGSEVGFQVAAYG
ncbi:phage tail tape measure protein [Streptosporangium sp. NBC_01755]|uniref:phage tail tape measure protein n=1 Tax=Streptosporangium sp. NBC_01755 TaxID=2975949 RepID=UPI002DDA4294|nr:phage tail tape measure protein [Streptosporangium sp. NBC_01755]WSC98397.1 phage tail tape measure protein [Streptosporangium sp. NBC_01755]